MDSKIKKLELGKETLMPLQPSDLGTVHGGAAGGGGPRTNETGCTPLGCPRPEPRPQPPPPPPRCTEHAGCTPLAPCNSRG